MLTMTASAQQGHGVFISYRRSDAAFPAGWLYEQLTNHFGNEHVFKDIDSIRTGDDFVEVITNALRSCYTVLVLIGPAWLSPMDDSSRRSIDAPDDFVRTEIEIALKNSGVRIIPVLVLGAKMPGPNDLPVSIAALARRNAIEITPNHFSSDLRRLIDSIERVRRE